MVGESSMIGAALRIAAEDAGHTIDDDDLAT
jgi:hypothetical protein